MKKKKKKENDKSNPIKNVKNNCFIVKRQPCLQYLVRWFSFQGQIHNYTITMSIVLGLVA